MVRGRFGATLVLAICLYLGRLGGMSPPSACSSTPGASYFTRSASRLVPPSVVVHTSWSCGTPTLVCITTLRDVTGNPAAPLFFAAATMVLTVVALGAFRWIERRRVTSPRP